MLVHGSYSVIPFVIFQSEFDWLLYSFFFIFYKMWGWFNCVNNPTASTERLRKLLSSGCQDNELCPLALAYPQPCLALCESFALPSALTYLHLNMNKVLWYMSILHLHTRKNSTAHIHTGSVYTNIFQYICIFLCSPSYMFSIFILYSYSLLHAGLYSAVCHFAFH